MNNQILENCPKCNNKWNHIIDEGSQKICICSKCNYTKFYALSSPNENDINSILKELKDSKLPRVITSSYENLISLLEYDEVYGALIKIKDTFELVIKLPLVIMLSHIGNKVYHKETSNTDFINEFSSLHILLQEFIHDAVSYQLTLGNWVTISGAIKSKKVADLFENTDAAAIFETLYHINQINHKAFTSNKHGEPVAAWRNKTIGHGALNCNKEEVKKDIINKLQLLNALLRETKNEYSKINISITNDLITVSSTNNSTNIIVEPFITITKEESNEDANKITKSFQLDNLSIFDSYNDKKQIGHVINHVNGKKVTSDDLSETLSFIDSNFKKAKALEVLNAKGFGNLTDDTIYTDTIELLNTLQSSTFYQGTYFSNWFINCIDNYTGGVFLCCAERGMGKSAFTRAIDQNEDVNIKDNATLTTYLSEHENILIRTFHFNSYYNSDVFTFIARLKDIFTSELIVEENKTSYIKSITYIARSIEENYVSLFNSLNDETIEPSKRKSLFLKFLKSLHSVWKHKYYKEKLVIVLDGIDEIKYDTANINIADWIPTQEEIKIHKLENIYFVLTSRCLDEVASNYELSSFLDSKIFTDTLFLKRESENSKYESPYSNTFIADIQNSLVTKANGETKRYTRKEAIQLGNVLEWRFNYLTAYKKIYQICTEEELQTFTNDPFVAYINHLDKLSKSYSQDIQLLLNLLAMTDEALTISEINYLLTGDNRPTFRTYGMLMDIANFLTIERDYRRGTLFNLSHPDWLEKIKTNPSLQYTKLKLITNLISFFLNLVNQDFTNIDVSGEEYDGESWLLANLSLLKIPIKEEYATLFLSNFSAAPYKIHRQIRSYEYIINYYNKCELTTLSINEFQLYLNSHIYIARIYDINNNFELAQEYGNLALTLLETYQQSIHTLKHSSHKYLPIEIYNNITTLYDCQAFELEKSSPEKAISFYNKSINILKELVSMHNADGMDFDPSILAFAYLARAKYLTHINPDSALKDFNTGIEYFKQAAANAEMTKTFFDYNLLAQAYISRATLFESISLYGDVAYSHYNKALGDYDKAIKIQRKLYKIHKNGGAFFNCSSLAYTYELKASLLEFTESEQPFAYYSKAINIRKYLTESSSSEDKYSNLYQLSISYWQRSKCERTPQKSLDDITNAIDIQSYLANEYLQNGKYFNSSIISRLYIDRATLLINHSPAKALGDAITAIDILKRIAEKRDRDGVFFDLNELASAYFYRASFYESVFLSKEETNKSIYRDKALDDFTAAIDIKTELADEYKKYGVFFDLNELANAYRYRAKFFESVFLSKEETNKSLYRDKALDDFAAVVDIYTKLIDEYKNGGNFFDSNVLAKAYLSRAKFYESVCISKEETNKSLYRDKALDDFAAAIDIQTKLNDEYEKGGNFFDSNILAETYLSRAKFCRLKQSDQAFKDYESAIKIQEKLAANSDNSFSSFELHDLVYTYDQFSKFLRKKDVAMSEEYHNKKEILSKTIFNRI